MQRYNFPGMHAGLKIELCMTGKGHRMEIWMRPVLAAMGAAVGCAILPFCVNASAAGLPTQIRIVVPFEPGPGGIDYVARLLATNMDRDYATETMVINRPGASGNTGTAYAGRLPPDGGSLLVTGSSHLVSPFLHSRPGYDALKDFVPVARIATAPNVIVLNNKAFPPGMDASLPKLLRERKQVPTYGSGGYGSTMHLAAAMFAADTRQELLHVPYKGTGPAVVALISGEIDMMFVPSGAVLSVLETGKAHAYAVMGAQRMALLPEVPTVRDRGFGDIYFSQWYGVLAPRGISPDMLTVLQARIRGIVGKPEVSKSMEQLGLQVEYQDAEHFGLFLADQQKSIARLVKAGHIEKPIGN